jgi:hypothetical protein
MKIQEDATCIFDVNCGAGSSLMYTSQIYFLYLCCQRPNLNLPNFENSSRIILCHVQFLNDNEIFHILVITYKLCIENLNSGRKFH